MKTRMLLVFLVFCFVSCNKIRNELSTRYSSVRSRQEIVEAILGAAPNKYGVSDDQKYRILTGKNDVDAINRILKIEVKGLHVYGNTNSIIGVKVYLDGGCSMVFCRDFEYAKKRIFVDGQTFVICDDQNGFYLRSK